MICVVRLEDVVVNQRVLLKRIPETFHGLCMKNRCNVHSKNDANIVPAINPIANQKKNAIITNSFLSLVLI